MSERVTSAARDQRPFVKQLVMSKTVTIVSTALDAGNTGQTHILREGLALGRVTASGKYKEYNAAGGDGSEDCDAILLHQVDLKNGDPGASATDHEAVVMVCGVAVSDTVLLYDAAAAADLAKAGSGLGYIEFETA